MPPSACSYSPLADSSRWCIHKACIPGWCQYGLSSSLEQPPKVKFYASVSSRVSFLYLKYKQQPDWPARLSSDLASCAISRSSSVRRSFFCADVIGITSWAPDVVILVHLLPSTWPHPQAPPQKSGKGAWSHFSHFLLIYGNICQVWPRLLSWFLGGAWGRDYTRPKSSHFMEACSLTPSPQTPHPSRVESGNESNILSKTNQHAYQADVSMDFHLA